MPRKIKPELLQEEIENLTYLVTLNETESIILKLSQRKLKDQMA